jgi:hypothetical protein
VITRLRQALVAVLGGRGAPPADSASATEREQEPIKRIEVARQRLKETIPPPEDE